MTKRMVLVPIQVGVAHSTRMSLYRLRESSVRSACIRNENDILRGLSSCHGDERAIRIHIVGTVHSQSRSVNALQ